MRIAVLLRRFENSRGAEQSLLTLVEKLSKNHTVRVFGIGAGSDFNVDYTVEMVPSSRIKHTYIPVTVNRTFKFLSSSFNARGRLSSFDPDLVLSQHWLSLLGAWWYASRGVSHIIFLHDYEFLTDYGKNGLYDRTLEDPFPINQFNWIWNALNRRIIRYIFDNSSLIISNSEYLSDKYAEHWDVNSEVIYPFVTKKRVLVSETGKKIGHVTPTRAKGVDITLDIAAELTDQEFVLVGKLQDAPTIRRRANLMENVTIRGYVDNIKDFYRECRLLLAPSRWPEPYGMVPVEAGVNGIPTLCSGNGGLAEAVGHSGFIIESNAANDYVAAIQDVLEDYQRYSSIARKQANSRLAPESFDRFKGLAQEYNIAKL